MGPSKQHSVPRPPWSNARFLCVRRIEWICSYKRTNHRYMYIVARIALAITVFHDYRLQRDRYSSRGPYPVSNASEDLHNIGSAGSPSQVCGSCWGAAKSDPISPFQPAAIIVPRSAKSKPGLAANMLVYILEPQIASNAMMFRANNG